MGNWLRMRFSHRISNTRHITRFFLPWQLFIGTGILIIAICTLVSLISINRIFNIQLWTMFKQ